MRHGGDEAGGTTGLPGWAGAMAGCVACGAAVAGPADDEPLCDGCEALRGGELDREFLLEGLGRAPVRIDVRHDGDVFDIAVSPHRDSVASVSQVQLALSDDGVVVRVWSDGACLLEETLAVYQRGREVSA